MSGRQNNRAAVPEAKGALDRFKYEVASELGVPLKEGYNGDLTSRKEKHKEVLIESPFRGRTQWKPSKQTSASMSAAEEKGHCGRH